MRLSLLISILIHVVILWALLTLFNVVPQMRVPKTIYNVKIFRPFVAPKVEAPKEAPNVVVILLDEREEAGGKARRDET